MKTGRHGGTRIASLDPRMTVTERTDHGYQRCRACTFTGPHLASVVTRPVTPDVPPDVSLNGLPSEAPVAPTTSSPVGHRTTEPYSTASTATKWLSRSELLVLGVVTIAFGVAVLAWPEASLKVLAVLTGAWLLLSGLVRIAAAFMSGRGAARMVITGITGIIFVLAGLIALRNLVTALAVLALFFAIAWIFSGITELAAATQASGRTRWGVAALGVASILVGLAFLLIPAFSLGALILLSGLSSVASGIVAIVLGLRMQSTPKPAATRFDEAMS